MKNGRGTKLTNQHKIKINQITTSIWNPNLLTNIKAITNPDFYSGDKKGCCPKVSNKKKGPQELFMLRSKVNYGQQWRAEKNQWIGRTEGFGSKRGQVILEVPKKIRGHLLSLFMRGISQDQSWMGSNSPFFFFFFSCWGRI